MRGKFNIHEKETTVHKEEKRNQEKTSEKETGVWFFGDLAMSQAAAQPHQEIKWPRRATGREALCKLKTSSFRFVVDPVPSRLRVSSPSPPSGARRRRGLSLGTECMARKQEEVEGEREGGDAEVSDGPRHYPLPPRGFFLDSSALT